MVNFILKSSDTVSSFVQVGGGKATHMARLSQGGFPVPPWFCITSSALVEFIRENQLSSALKKYVISTQSLNLTQASSEIEDLFLNSKLSFALTRQLDRALEGESLSHSWVAVRSSGLDEDSAEHSFAGQFSSYLFQKGFASIQESLKRCWASAFSNRALFYRLERGLQIQDIRMGVVIQRMVNADAAGVAFSRNPVHPLDRDHLVVSSVWGLGEGLVSGELDADHFEVHRKSFLIRSQIVEKTHALTQKPDGGLIKTLVPATDQARTSLTDDQVREISRLTLALEERMGTPQDCEWAYEAGQLNVVQTRPITSLPKEAFFDSKVNGDFSILWDNSNIIESYNGVTSPLTFSFASACYRQVYIQFCEVVGVPKKVIDSHEPMFRNMLGLLRGRIFYNLKHWYQLVLMLPGSSKNQDFMNTMMGVKTGVKPELASEVSKILADLSHAPQYSLPRKAWIGVLTFYRFLRIDSIVRDFQAHFSKIYERSRKLPFSSMSTTELSQAFHELDDQILRRWHAPIINDYLCMVFFGVLKKLTEKWIVQGDEAGGSLQNDLLCGQGDLDSTEPTKMLMRIAAKVDHDYSDIRDWFLKSSPQEVWKELEKHLPNGKAVGEASSSHAQVSLLLADFLDRYGYRCINELKLEESDLHDDPTFVIGAIASYVKMKSYSISAMEEREKAIREKAESLVRTRISGFKCGFYFWVLKHARKAVKNRENLRFARTKVFGVARHLFRGMGSAFTRLGVLETPRDIFYLTIDEITAFIEGRSVILDLKPWVALRKAEYEKFRKTPAPPDRLITTGAASLSCLYPQVLMDADLLAESASAPQVSSDPNLFLGTPCCPGVIEGTIRVVESMSDAHGINGEILVTARTDPGWVPLFPSCSGLLIERGSLLSHSAVVARELGLPTIVGISGGMMKKLKTGQTVRIDAGKGEVRVIA